MTDVKAIDTLLGMLEQDRHVTCEIRTARVADWEWMIYIYIGYSFLVLAGIQIP